MEKKFIVHPVSYETLNEYGIMSRTYPRIEIRLTPCNDNYKLSIVGSAMGCGGQIHSIIMENFDAWKVCEGWTKEKLINLLNIWKRWHLNDMRAGTPRQQHFVEKWKAMGNKYDFSAVCEAMKAAGVYEDRGYRYGSAWLFEPLPHDVVDFINEIFKEVEEDD